MELWTSGFTCRVEVWSSLEEETSRFGNCPNVGLGGKKQRRIKTNNKITHIKEIAMNCANS